MDGASPDDAEVDGTSPDDAAAEGSAATDAAPGTCNAIVPDGPLVAQTVLNVTQPDAMGGHIFSGTYWLTERDTYGGTPDGLFVQRSLVIDAVNINVAGGQTADEAGAPVIETTTSSYQIDDSVVFSTDESCPGPPHTVNTLYTADGGQLTLYPDQDTAEIYTLQ